MTPKDFSKRLNGFRDSNSQTEIYFGLVSYCRTWRAVLPFKNEGVLLAANGCCPKQGANEETGVSVFPSITILIKIEKECSTKGWRNSMRQEG